MGFIDVVPLFLGALYVLLCPFNKVEESFHLQATHDILQHGRDVAAYDHLEFPGVVPRTFLGALYLAAASLPGTFLVHAFGLPKIFLQIVVRLTLALGVVSALIRVKTGVEDKFGRRTAVATILLLAATPHLLFYAGRTLPNVFAVYLVANGVAEWLRMERLPVEGAPLFPFRLTLSIIYFVLAVLWFRCDMLVLLGPVALSWLATGKAHIKHLVVVGGVVGTLALATTVVVDSWFWRRWLWPEGEVLFFNTVENRSHEYGVSPWHWYVTSALPRAMLAGVLFLPVGLLTLAPAAPPRVGVHPSLWSYARRLRLDWRVAEYVLPAFAFIGLYSVLPHKETRFLFPAMPLLLLAAGRGITKAHRAALWLLLGPEMVLPEPRPTAASSWEEEGALGLPGSPRSPAHLSPHHAGGRTTPSRTPVGETIPEVQEGEGEGAAAGVGVGVGAGRKPRPGPSPLGAAMTSSKLEENGGTGGTVDGGVTPQASTPGGGPEVQTESSVHPVLRHRRGKGSEVGWGAKKLSVDTSRAEEEGEAAAVKGTPSSRPLSAKSGAGTPTPSFSPRSRPAETGLVRRLSRGMLGELEEYAPRAPPGPMLHRLLAALALAGMAVSLLGSAVATALFVRVSMDNYPGGAALQRMYSLYARDLRRAAAIGNPGPELILWSLEQPGTHLPVCPEEDVTSSSSGVEWVRQCLGGACPPVSPWAMTGGSAGKKAIADARPCARNVTDPRARPIRVHIDVASAEAGVSRFGEAWHAGQSWVFSKAENLTLPEHFREFDLLLTESPSKHSKSFMVVGKEAIPVFSRVEVDWRRLRLRVHTQPRIYIMQRIPDQMVFKSSQGKPHAGAPLTRGTREKKE